MYLSKTYEGASVYQNIKNFELFQVVELFLI